MRNKLAICIASALGLAAPLVSQADDACKIVGVNDGGLNNSQFFSVNSETLEVSKIGEELAGYDIEALAAHPETGDMYAASGDDGINPGHLYRLNTETGALTDLGSTGFNEIEGLSFDKDKEPKLWAWAKGDGLIKIDLQNPSNSTLELQSSAKVEDIKTSGEYMTYLGGSLSTSSVWWCLWLCG